MVSRPLWQDSNLRHMKRLPGSLRCYGVEVAIAKILGGLLRDVAASQEAPAWRLNRRPFTGQPCEAHQYDVVMKWLYDGVANVANLSYSLTQSALPHVHVDFLPKLHKAP